MKKATTLGSALLVSLTVAGAAYAGGTTHATLDGGLTTTDPADWNTCGSAGTGEITAGPQSPRDIDLSAGSNATLFRISNNTNKMNMCDIHYHWNAEHKSAEYSTFVNSHDEHSGWAVVEPASTDPVYRTEHDIGGAGHEIGVILGDTIEIHWVHTSCDVNFQDLDPANGLGNCSTSVCANPQLRVMAQVFKVVDHDADVSSVDAPMEHTDATVIYTGATTGAGFNNDHCSPFQVSWDVKKTAATIDAHALTEWSHEMGQHAHDVRELVTHDNLLSPIETKGKK